MSEVLSLETRAEQLKLARVLGVDPDALTFLEGAEPTDLRELRRGIADDLFERDAHHFAGMIKLAQRFPVALSAQVAQHALGPALAAHAAGLLQPGMAAAFVCRLPAGFLADVAARADVGRLSHVLADLPVAELGEVAAELAAREEWIPMGAFVGYLDGPQLDAALAVLDSEALLRSGFVMEDKSHVDEIVRRLDDGQVLDYLRTALALDLLPEALDLAGHLGPEQLARMAVLLDELSDEELMQMARRVRDEALLEAAVAPLLEHASDRVRALSS